MDTTMLSEAHIALFLPIKMAFNCERKRIPDPFPDMAVLRCV